MSISPNEKLIATGSFDEILLWNLSSAECLFVINDHGDAIDSVILTNTLLYSGSHNSTIKIHLVNTGKCIRTMRGHKSGVTCLALCVQDVNKSRILVSGSRDHTIRLWKMGSFSQTLIYALRANDPSAVGFLSDDKNSFYPILSKQCFNIAIKTVLELDHNNYPLWHKLILSDDNATLVEILVKFNPELAYFMHPVLKRTAYDLTTGAVRAKMDNVLFFCGRYKISSGAVVHKSATSVVISAVDMSSEAVARAVVLKLIKDEDQFNREIDKRLGLDSEFVVPILSHSKSPALANRWCNDVAAIGFGEYPYGIILEAAERNLMVAIAQGWDILIETMLKFHRYHLLFTQYFLCCFVF